MGTEADSLLGALESSRYCTALTGAGISTLSGIPDFRGPRPAFLFPEEVFSFDRFEGDPAFFYKTAGPFVYQLHKKEPSVVHRVLAGLEKRGPVRAVITQNIDMLHQKAGSARVIELHGSPRFHYCLRCPGIRMGYGEAAEALEAGRLPQCPRCGAVLKPALTFYGEPLPLEARRQAEEELYKTDLLLVLGTGLSVFPAAELPRAALRRGGRIVIVNRQDTPLDGEAFLRFRELEGVFSPLETMLRRRRDPRLRGDEWRTCGNV
ncbi:MAG: NAD-dependent deacetylase [Spirochaetaceae bacterium]|jgi:NAD-dependent deacetylase|nr:NAD-dependent deacetylase [Spirochaetaceae bacterium]